MKASIIITTYNHSDMLKKILDALTYQTRLPDEVIVADDGSGSDTRDVIRCFITDSLYPIYHVWQEDRGFRLAEIRNKAIKKSDSDYLIFLDGDCIPHKYFFEDHLRLARKGFFFQGKRILVSQRLSPEFTYKNASFFKLVKYMFLNDISNSHHIFRIPYFPSLCSTRMSGIRGCNMGFFKDDLFAVNGFNQDFTSWGREDSELAARLYRYGLKRKEHPFMAICFHLWHKKNDAAHLAANDEILQKTIESDNYICKNGLKQF